LQDYSFQFAAFIYDHYGRIGCAVAFLIMVTLLSLTYYLLNLLPEPKERKIVESDFS